MREGGAALRRAADARRGCPPRGVVSVGGPNDRAVRLWRGACSGRKGRSVQGGWGGPVLDVEVARLSVGVEVVVRRVRVVGLRRGHGEAERSPGGRRGRSAVDVMGQCELRGDVRRWARRRGWIAVRRIGGIGGTRAFSSKLRT